MLRWNSSVAESPDSSSSTMGSLVAVLITSRASFCCSRGHSSHFCIWSACDSVRRKMCYRLATLQSLLGLASFRIILSHVVKPCRNERQEDRRVSFACHIGRCCNKAYIKRWTVCNVISFYGIWINCSQGETARSFLPWQWNPSVITKSCYQITVYV